MQVRRWNMGLGRGMWRRRVGTCEGLVGECLEEAFGIPSN